MRHWEYRHVIAFVSRADTKERYYKIEDRAWSVRAGKEGETTRKQEDEDQEQMPQCEEICNNTFRETSTGEVGTIVTGANDIRAVLLHGNLQNC